MNVAEMREKSAVELNEEITSIAKQLAKLRLEKAVGEGAKTHHFKLLKKQIAQVKTILTEKEAGETNG